MISEVTLEFPEFITHIPQNKNKWIKIGYNKIYTGGHFWEILYKLETS
jgi:hypothetical protein